MKKQLIMITIMVSLGSTTGVFAHGVSHDIPIGYGPNDLNAYLKMARRGEKKPHALSYSTLVANNSTVPLEVKVGLAMPGDKWEIVEPGKYRVFYHKVKGLSIKSQGSDDVLTQQGDEDDAITIIEEVFGDGRISRWRSVRPKDV